MIREALHGQVMRRGAYPWVMYAGPHDGNALGHIPPGYALFAGTACVWHEVDPRVVPLLAELGMPVIVAWVARRDGLAL